MGNEVAQASERKSLIITPFGTIFFHQPPAREEGVGGAKLLSKFGAIGIKLAVR